MKKTVRVRPRCNFPRFSSHPATCKLRPASNGREVYDTSDFDFSPLYKVYFKKVLTHPELVEELEDFAVTRVGDVEKTQSYHQLKMSVINTEVMLGDAERQYEEKNEKYEGFIQALDSIWANVCQAALKKATSLAGNSSSFSSDLKSSPAEIQTALHDNYVWAALAAVFSAHRNQSMKLLPMLPAAAINKHKYTGYKDEVACLRMLLWAGFDPDAQDEDGMTAMHYMASLMNPPYGHPRAVRLLLGAGAKPDIQNVRGDTALCYLSGIDIWGGHLHDTSWMLLEAGADPNLPAKDGATAFSLMRSSDSRYPENKIFYGFAERQAEKQAALFEETIGPGMIASKPRSL